MWNYAVANRNFRSASVKKKKKNSHYQNKIVHDSLEKKRKEKEW